MKISLFQLCALAVLASALVGGLTPSAQARLGETKAQLIERYGEPLREVKSELPASDDAALFFAKQVEVWVEFKNDKAWLVVYRMHRLTSELEAQFRDANDGIEGDVGDWHEPVEHLGRTYWKTTDGKVTGVRYLIGNSQVFRFCNSACLIELIDAREAKIDGVIAGVTRFGLFVMLVGKHIEGLVHISTLQGDYFRYDADNQSLIGDRTGREYGIGDPVVVQLARVDSDERRIDLELINHSPLKGRRRVANVGRDSGSRSAEARKKDGKRGKGSSRRERGKGRRRSPGSRGRR